MRLAAETADKKYFFMMFLDSDYDNKTDVLRRNSSRFEQLTAGEHKFKVQVSSDQIKSPITKEENTRFYKE